MLKFCFNLASIFFMTTFLSVSQAEGSSSSSDHQKNQHKPCCGKLEKTKCKVKKGFVRIPERTQTFFTGAPDCTSSQETVPPAELYFRIQGKFHSKKPTIVFVHGFGETGDVWKCAQQELCDKYLTIAMDLRGYGRSSKTPAIPDPNGIHYTVDLSVEDVFELLNQLGITKNIVLVGHSIGASYAFKYAALHQEQISKLVMIGGPAFVVPDCALDSDCATNCFNPFTCETGFCWPFGLPTSTAIAVATPLFDCLNQGGDQKECLRAWGKLIAPIWFNDPCQNQLQDAQASLVSAVVSNTPSIISNIFFVAATEDLRPLIPQVTVPTLICFGDIDAVINPGTGQFYHDNMPNSVLAEFIGKGHELHVTDYKNFNRLLGEFIRSCQLPDTIKVFDEGCCVCPKLKSVNYAKQEERLKNKESR